ncbi:MAG: response regulator receiver [Acidobacteriaceae bacterium]|nr:response regulator receiver [Acidobacteriaceae bacterium]
MKNDPKSIRLLLVEDDELTRELLAIQLAGEGYQFATVESGDAALIHLEQNPSSLPDAVVTDLQMPGLCGVELATHLHRLPQPAGSAGMVLLAMSASTPAADLFGSYDGFLLKPFTMDELATALQQAAAGVAAFRKDEITADIVAGPLDEAAHQHLVDAIPTAQLEQLYALFLEDVETRIEKMRLAAAHGEDATYRREAHSIKGGCGMVGAAELQSLAMTAERKGIDPANHVASLDELMAACSRFRRILVAQHTRATY